MKPAWISPTIKLRQNERNAPQTKPLILIIGWKPDKNERVEMLDLEACYQSYGGDANHLSSALT